MNLFLSSDPRPVHFVGIAGAGMSALAMLALRRGVTVTGSDRAPEGAPDLPRLGAKVLQGHDPSRVEGARAVVTSAAIAPDHPELARARALGIPIVPRKRALADLVAGATTVAIAGTHGKTTTTVMTTTALAAAGLDPTGLAGGRVEAWGGNARVGSDRLFVVEADEYDRAFLELSPTVAVVNNIEPEHLECYDGSVERLEEAFADFAAGARTVLVGTADGASDRLAARLAGAHRQPARAIWRFGPGARDLAIGPIRADPESTSAPVRLPDGRTVVLALGVPGRHNMLNATAALGVVYALEGGIVAALEALRGFGGVGRRFERRGEAGGATLIDDYAHHATEVEATLAAARQAYPGRRLVVVFQPHLYSRTAVQADRQGAALAGADLVYVTEVYAAREAPVPGVSGLLVAEAVKRAGTAVRFVSERPALVEAVAGEIRRGDVVLTLGAGDITTLVPALLDRLGP